MSEWWHDAAYRIGWTVLHSTWEGAACAAVLAVALIMTRRRSPQLRYGLSGGALGLFLMAVAFTCWVSDAPRASRVGGSRQAAIAPTVHDPSLLPAWAASSDLPVEDDAAAVVAPSAISSRVPVPFAVTIRPALPWLAATWAAGVWLLAVWNVLRWIGVQRLRTRGLEPAGERLEAMVARLQGRLSLRRPVQIARSWRVDAPMVMGWLRPLIMVPCSIFSGLSPAQVEAILAHELAHVRRHDYLINLLQVAAETLVFYHPAVWWISRRMRIERELCCDAVAAEACGDRVAYAESLAALAEMACGPSTSVAMAARGPAGGQLLDRVRRVLGIDDRDDDAPRRPGARTVVATLALLVSVALAPLSCRRASNVGVAAPLASSSEMVPAATRPAPPSTIPAAGTVAEAAEPVTVSLSGQPFHEVSLDRLAGGNLEQGSLGPGNSGVEGRLVYVDADAGTCIVRAHPQRPGVFVTLAPAGTRLTAAQRDALNAILVRHPEVGHGASFVIVITASPVPDGLALDAWRWLTLHGLPRVSLVYGGNEPKGWARDFAQPAKRPAAGTQPATTQTLWHNTRPAVAGGKLLLVTDGNYFLERAAEATGLPVTEMKPADFDRGVLDRFSVAWFDRFTPRFLPPTPGIYFDAHPSWAGRVEAGGTVGGQQAKDWDRHSDVVGALSLEKLFVAQAMKLRESPDCEVLVRGDRGPLIVSHRESGSRQILVAFDVNQSNWPLQASFPLFLSRATDWVLGLDPSSAAGNNDFGVLCRDADGRPVAGAEVFVAQPPLGEHLSGPTVVGPFRSGADGIAHIIGLPSSAGRSVEQDVYARVAGKKVGGDRRSTINPFDGEPADDPFPLVMVDARELRGTVTVPPGHQASDVTVRLRGILTRRASLQGAAPPGVYFRFAEEQAWAPAVHPREDGSFIIADTPAGSQSYLELSGPGLGETQWMGPQAEGEDAEHVRLTMAPEGVIQGRVTYEVTGKPAVGIKVIARGGKHRIRPHDFAAVTNEEGRYRLSGLPLLPFEVSVANPPHEWYVTTRQPEIVLAPGRRSVDANFVLQHGAVIHGTVVSATTGAPIVGAMVEAMCFETWAGDHRDFGPVLTAADGSWSVRVPPGLSQVQVTDAPGGYVLDDEQTRQPRTRHVNVGSPDDIAGVVLKLYPSKPSAPRRAPTTQPSSLGARAK